MATQEYENGKAKTNYLADIIAKVRTGWITAVFIVSIVTNLAAALVVNGWVIAPARSTDLKAAVEVLKTNQLQLQSIGPAVVRLEESMKGATRQLDSLDHKVDVLIGRPPVARTQVIVKPKSFFGN
jgi:shikimate kinase